MKTHQIIITVGAGIVSLCAGTLLSSSHKDLGKSVTLASLFTLPTVASSYWVLDRKATKRITQAQDKARQVDARAKQSEGKAQEIIASLALSNSKLSEVEGQNSQLQDKLVTLTQSLEFASGDRSRLSGMIATLDLTITQLEQDLEASRDQVEQLQIEVEAWEAEFSNRVESEAQRRFKVARAKEIQAIFDEHDAITAESMALFRRLQGWAQKIASGHESKREIIQTLAASYNNNLDQLSDSVEAERGHYLEQIELLNMRVGRLQHQLAGDLLEPEINNTFGYAIEGRIANDLAKLVFSDLQIPLAVKGFYVKSDGSVEVGYGYSRSIPSEAVIEGLKRHSDHLAKRLGIYRITGVKKLEIADLIVLTFRREPAIKEDTIKLIAGTPEQFLEYISAHPLRYRLIADPGSGKTPVTAVMVSEILKVGGTRGNTGKGRKIANTLVTVSCPDVESSQKDADYPLEIFLKYGNTTAAVKSFSDADEDWRYRKRNTNYANDFFQLWVWDELDNTLNNADDPKAVGERFKNFLKQAHHTGVGWIVSGQSVMTKQIPGFMDDDRELFTQIIIGTGKIRKYLEKYGKKILSTKVVAQLLNNLDDLEPYIEDKNSWVTDAARLLRLALVLDDKSPKLYFLPNLDRAYFDAEKIEVNNQKAELVKRSFLTGTTGNGLAGNGYKPCQITTDNLTAVPSNPTIGGSSQSGQKPHCCHCGGHELNLLSDGRYRCLGCKKRFVSNKSVWK